MEMTKEKTDENNEEYVETERETQCAVQLKQRATYPGRRGGAESRQERKVKEDLLENPETILRLNLNWMGKGRIVPAT